MFSRACTVRNYGHHELAVVSFKDHVTSEGLMWTRLVLLVRLQFCSRVGSGILRVRQRAQPARGAIPDAAQDEQLRRLRAAELRRRHRALILHAPLRLRLLPDDYPGGSERDAHQPVAADSAADGHTSTTTFYHFSRSPSAARTSCLRPIPCIVRMSFSTKCCSCKGFFLG